MLARNDCEKAIAEALEGLLERIDLRNIDAGSDGRKVAVVLHFDDEKGFGFLRLPESDDSIFFHRTDLKEQSSKIFLVTGTTVSCEVAKEEKGMRAKVVAVELTESTEDELLSRRRGNITSKAQHHLRVRDSQTKTLIHVDDRLERSPSCPSASRGQ